MSINWLSDVVPPPQILVRPGGAVSLDEAHSAIELWEHYSRKTLDPAQRQVVEVIMATDSAGLWAASTTGRCEPRQNGKGDEIEVVELHGLVQRAEAILHTVHDAVLLASQTQQRMLGVLEGHADLRRLVKRKWLGTGQQMIELRNGGVIWYRTRTGGGGRGVDDIDRLVVDEAQHAADEHLAALTPTMLANENAQLNALGSAGIEGKSDWWWQMRLRALGDDPGGLGYVEHTAETVYLNEAGFPVQEPVDPSDRALWLQSNPALHTGRGRGMVFFEEQYRRTVTRSFCREHLGVWDPPTLNGATATVFGESWDAWCGEVQPRPEVFSLDVNPDRSSASIGVADSDGVCALSDHRSQVGWAVDEIIRLYGKHRAPVAVQSNGAAGALIVDLERAGVQVIPYAAAAMRDACGSMFDAVTEGKGKVRADNDLDRAVASAMKKTSGDAWVWDRRGAADISPLVAITIARHAALTGGGPSVYEEKELRVF